ncbi:MAG: HAMP domain-containing histidine kinase [Deltaproteobacteria bacterium]|nr:HAMP domain-containing histidine kinase [Deltaproteobacteria bacterium]
MLRSQQSDEGRRALGALVAFSRLVTHSATPEEILAGLARAVAAEVDVAAAAVLEVTPDGGSRLAAAAGLPDELAGFLVSEELVGSELGDALLTALDGAFERAETIPLVSGGDVFGSLVLLHRSARGLGPEAPVLVEGLVDLAASGLASAARYAELARSYTQLRDSRAALERGERLRALGQMAAGISHDLRNILYPLSLHLQFLRRLVSKEAVDAQDSIAQMQGVLKRGLETLEALRSFSHQAPSGRPEAVELDRMVREAIGIGRARAKSSVSYRIVEDLHAPPPVTVAASECVSALVNLLVNAIDAMPTGGTITLSTGESGGGSWVRVADDGPGMPPEVQHKVFEPFFTTKGDEGTGLGLAMVYAFARRSGGRVDLETAPGAGAAFTLWFPRAAS